MLIRLLQEIESSQGVVRLNELSRRLWVERSALEGMLAYLVRKGRLQCDDQIADTASSCANGRCSGTCAGPEACPFIIRTTKMYSIPSRDTK
jgi:hypothetical protein